MHSEPAPVGAGPILQDACFRPGYVNNIVQNWLPALDGVEEKLKPGSKVGDVGCGCFVGFDFRRRGTWRHGAGSPDGNHGSASVRAPLSVPARHVTKGRKRRTVQR